MDNVFPSFVIKEAILSEEKNRISEFLKKFDLNYESDITYSIYMEDENGNIVGTVSLNNYIIKCLAISPEYQGENLAGELIDNLINKLRSDNKFYYSVYTKHEYEPLFLSLGFSKIASTDKVSMLEFGSPKIDEVMNRLKVKIESTLDCRLDDSKVACVVANANPFTNGHLSLVEEAIYRRYDYVIVFIVQEDKSYFSEKERMALAYVSLLPYDNVVVVPSTRYMVSSMTFPGYFLHDKKLSEWARIDCLIFRDYFMKKLNIQTRFVGEETDDYMVEYNNILKETIGEGLVILDRTKQDDEIISAKIVRKHLDEGRLDEALKLVPRGSWVFHTQIFNSKKNK